MFVITRLFFFPLYWRPFGSRVNFVNGPKRLFRRNFNSQLFNLISIQFHVFHSLRPLPPSLIRFLLLPEICDRKTTMLIPQTTTVICLRNPELKWNLLPSLEVRKDWNFFRAALEVAKDHFNRFKSQPQRHSASLQVSLENHGTNTIEKTLRLQLEKFYSHVRGSPQERHVSQRGLRTWTNASVFSAPVLHR